MGSSPSQGHHHCPPPPHHQRPRDASRLPCLICKPPPNTIRSQAHGWAPPCRRAKAQAIATSGVGKPLAQPPTSSPEPLPDRLLWRIQNEYVPSWPVAARPKPRIVAHQAWRPPGNRRTSKYRLSGQGGAHMPNPDDTPNPKEKRPPSVRSVGRKASPQGRGCESDCRPACKATQLAHGPQSEVMRRNRCLKHHYPSQRWALCVAGGGGVYQPPFHPGSCQEVCSRHQPLPKPSSGIPNIAIAPSPKLSAGTRHHVRHRRGIVQDRC